MSELYLSNVSNNNSVKNLQKVAYGDYSNYESPYYRDSQRSANITLQKGQYYLMQAFRTFYNNDISHFSIGVEVPSNFSTMKSVGSVQSLDISFDKFRECQEIRITGYKSIGKFKIVVAARNPT